jgi:hypothetical protein
MLNSNNLSLREKLVLAGLYLSKFDKAGLKRLGFTSFTEAFNVIGYSLESRPASVKNYRDEFDPLFPNNRVGWHQRPRREYCTRILDKYGDWDMETFANFLISYTETSRSFVDPMQESLSASSFANRMITGIAAEHYFEEIHPKLAPFKDYKLTNTTRLGCGFDFRLVTESENNFLAVEVKGLSEPHGALSFTSKEYDVAVKLRNKYCLFVVSNFRETPFHSIYMNPISSDLAFIKKERTITQISWSTSI